MEVVSRVVGNITAYFGGGFGLSAAEVRRHLRTVGLTDENGDFFQSPGPRRIWYILGFKLLAAAAFTLYQSVMVELLRNQFMWKSAGTVDWVLHISSIAASTMFAYNVETSVPLYLALWLFIGLMIVGFVVTLFGAFVNLSILVLIGGLCAFSGSVAVHPWMTVYAADQLPKVKASQRSTLFMYAFSSMYLGMTLADASAPTLLAKFGSSGLLVVVSLVLAAATAVLIRGSKNAVQINATGPSGISSLMTAFIAVKYDISNLSANERTTISNRDGISGFVCWVDRAAQRIPAEIKAVVKALVMLAPYALVLGAFHIGFGVLELNASLHGAGSGGLHPQICMTMRSLEVVKAIYAIVVVPFADLLLLPLLWTGGDASAKPTPLRRVAVGMGIGVAACLLTIVSTTLELFQQSSSGGCVVVVLMQVFRSAFIVLAEVLVGGACIELAYACGLHQSSAGRVSATWFLYVWIALGENISPIFTGMLGFLLPAPAIFGVCALLCVLCSVYYTFVAWPKIMVGMPDAIAEHTALPGTNAEEEHVPPVTTHQTMRQRKKANEPAPPAATSTTSELPK